MIDLISSELGLIIIAFIGYLLKEGSNKYQERKIKERELDIPQIERVPVSTLHDLVDKITSGVATAITIFAAKFYPDSRELSEEEIKGELELHKLNIPSSGDTLIKQLSKEFNSQFERFSSEIQRSFDQQGQEISEIRNSITSLNVRVSELEVELNG